ncbi:MAG: DnaJ domain-containing protein [Bryobacterales bacterium]|nr:DnaJ domain-containing protein [Bryobacterales bacterium]
MTFYDELGLPPQASAEEIREAYRTLVRLLHPDQYQEEKLRRAAEIQLRRLNFVYAELSDPERRRRYDQSLGALVAPVAPVRRLRSSAGVIAVAVCAGLGAGWFLRGLEPGRSRAQPAMPSGIASPPSARPAPSAGTAADGLKVPRRAQDAASPRANGRQEQPEARPHAPPGGEPPAPTAGSGLEARSLEPIGPPPVPSGAPAPASRFAGRWLYSASRSPAQSPGDPPEYIELAIAETGGRVRGSYRARYRILGRAVSRYVVFEFEGEAPASSGCKFLWTGPGGAWGEVWLELLSENALAVRWSAAEVSRQLAVTADAAVLTRLREP